MLATGCAVTPQTRQSLATYVNASDRVLMTADELVTGYADNSQAQERAQAQAQADERGTTVPTPPEYPDRFVPPADPKFVQTATAKSLAETRQALAVIREYNALLVALAEGRSDQEVRDQTVAFGGALQGVLSIANVAIPGLLQFSEYGSKIVKLVQDAANREQLAKAIAEGRAPLAEVLKALELQTEAMYDVAVELTAGRQVASRVAIQRSAAALATLCQLHALPSPDSAIALKMAALQAQAGAVARMTRTDNAVTIPFPFVAGKPAVNAAAYAEAEIFVQSMRTSAQKYADLVAAQNAYYDVMSKYAAALRETRKSFDLLAASLTAPVDLQVESIRILKVALELRDAVARYRNPPLASAAP